ncbi:MAG TPA: TetR/AcrR family transcriptional regulator [Edaphobacter sp.]|jgi:TetR/AcrR family transcriptional regulator, transcriptional repressor for nem operon|nr:TetR/AcrR family transcriptional regulator [Edaphobacter sp.]
MSKGEATRQRIIAEAAVIFNQHGYEGCSIQQIMAATGLEKGGIYRHFESKEELAAEAFDYAWQLAVSRRWANLDSIPNHVDLLKRYIANYNTRSTLPGGCPLLNTAVDSDNGNPILRERVRKALRGWQSRLKKILQDGIAAGTIKPEIDITQVASLIIGGLEGGMLLSRIEKSDQPLHSALKHLDDYIETQIRNPALRPTKKLQPAIS